MARSTRSTFVITRPETVAPLRTNLEDDHHIFVLDGTDDARTLQMLHEHTPGVVALDRRFLESRAGREFVGRLRDAAEHKRIDLRVFSGLDVRKPSSASARAMLASACQPLPEGVGRRVERVPMADDVAAVVSGASLVVVDLSVLGAQVISPGVLRPNQQVALRLLETEGELRLKAAIAWSQFERSAITRQPQYRAGLEFTAADPNALQRYCRDHRRLAETLQAVVGA
jgi:hypothetical protein